MSAPNAGAADYIELTDYRAKVSSLYADIRSSSASPEDTWLAWCEGRRELLAAHPQSVFPAADLPPAPFWKYSPHWRTTGTIIETAVDDLLLEEGEGVIRRFTGVGNVEFRLGEATHQLPIYWADSYGGGWLLAFRDSTNGTFTFGSGKYVLDGAKGADLGVTDSGELIIDFNYSYHPSCVWGNWICPLPNPEARLPIAVSAGESKHEADEIRHGYRCERFNCGAFILDGAEHDCC